MHRIDYYKVLEVTPTASAETIRGAYRALSKKYHPDTYQGDPKLANERMKEINEAYGVLSDPVKRKEYDSLLSDIDEDVITDIPFSDNNVTSAPKPNKENNAQGQTGCLSKIIGVIFWIIVISLIVRACLGNDKGTDDVSSTQSVVTTDESGNNSAMSDNEQDTLSPLAQAAEIAFFHKEYTDLGTVEIHHFEERKEVLEFLAKLSIDKTVATQGKYLSKADSLFKGNYFYFSEEQTNLYYIGESKNNMPHGFGGIFSVATGSGTYEFAGEVLILYVGNFKNGMLDGYGAYFAADQTDLTRTITDIADITTFSEDIGERIVQYLFNYVSYEGYFSKNEKVGKGNSFDFPIYEDPAVGARIAFINELNPSLDGYIFGPVYPNITMGEYKDGELFGEVKRFKYNHLVYNGTIQDGEFQIENVICPNDQFDIHGLYCQNVWGSDILYDCNGFYGFFDGEESGEYNTEESEKSAYPELAENIIALQPTIDESNSYSGELVYEWPSDFEYDICKSLEEYGWIPIPNFNGIDDNWVMQFGGDNDICVTMWKLDVGYLFFQDINIIDEQGNVEDSVQFTSEDGMKFYVTALNEHNDSTYNNQIWAPSSEGWIRIE